jgi:hypothetical protein
MISRAKDRAPQPAILKDILWLKLPGRDFQTYLAIQKRLPTSNPSDPFKKYPFFRASLWATNFAEVEIVPASCLQGPYGSCEVAKGTCVVISLDKVRGIFQSLYVGGIT